MIIKRFMYVLLAILPAILQACGDPQVNVAEQSYEPKISIEAYVFGGETVRNIKIRRNYPLGVPIDLNNLTLTPAANGVIAEINGIRLQYDTAAKMYYNNLLSIECGKTYKLTVRAVIDGRQLYAESVTTVPNAGFKLLGGQSIGDKKYLQDPIEIKYNPSAGKVFYVFSFIARQANQFSYIYENPYESKPDTADVIKYLNDFRTQYDAIGELSGQASDVFAYNVDYFNLKFYGQYKVAAYAGDINFKNFLYSAGDVKEADGNFHEPVPVVHGDGVGIFASAIRDSLVFTVVK